MAITVNLDPPDEARDELTEALSSLRSMGNTPRKSGEGWVARCPAHEDTTASLSLTEGRDGRLILHCHAGCAFADVKAKLGIPDRRPPGAPRNEHVPPTAERRIVATYPYTDEHGEVLFEALRYEPKDFRQRRPDGRGGWTYSLGDARRVLYRLPLVRRIVDAGGIIYIAEGEKDVEALELAGVTATCSPMGAGKWRDEHAQALQGASAIIIIADKDEPGLKHAQTIAASLLELDIPHVVKTARTGKDAADHLAAGHTLDELEDYEPGAEPPPEAPDAPSLAWEPLDLVTLGDTPRIPPELGGLIYTRRRHLLSGESESGKSWLAFCIAADELLAGHGVVWVDLDYMGAQDILERLRQLGVPDEVTRERFAFYQPEGKLEGSSLDAVTDLIHEKRARLVVIDAFTGFCALHGLKPNEGIDIEHAYRLMQPLCDTGAAVIILDHVVKDPGSRGRYAAGSERKLSGADVALGFTLIDHYGRGRTGRSRLTVHKDRPAQLQRPVAGIFTLRSDPFDHRVTWAIEEDHSKGEGGTFRPTRLMENISKHLETQGDRGASQRAIIDAVPGNDHAKKEALRILVDEEYASVQDGIRRALIYTTIRPYREADDARD